MLRKNITKNLHLLQVIFKDTRKMVVLTFKKNGINFEATFLNGREISEIYKNKNRGMFT